MPESIDRQRTLTAIAFLGLVSPVLAAEPDFGGAPDPTKVIGHESCAKCHAPEIDRWSQTPHAQTLERLHRTEEAKAIAKRLGMRSVKRNDACVRCHYTEQQQGARNRIVAGVSCESCHGAAKDWLDLHADYGAPGIGPESESPTHRRQRREKSIAAGMNNPSNLYLIARQCLACHATPSESIVNTGGHKAGSDEFDLVAWSQGMVRHNFQRSGNNTNAPSSLRRVRVMYLVGLLADLEASLRAVSKATSADTYGSTAAARAARVKQKLWAAQRKIEHPMVGEALEVTSTLQLTLGNEDELAAAAKRIGEIAYRLADEEDGSSLAALDALLPPPSTYK